LLRGFLIMTVFAPAMTAVPPAFTAPKRPFRHTFGESRRESVDVAALRLRGGTV
jgi:hypothetical protein